MVVFGIFICSQCGWFLAKVLSPFAPTSLLHSRISRGATDENSSNQFSVKILNGE